MQHANLRDVFAPFAPFRRLALGVALASTVFLANTGAFADETGFSQNSVAAPASLTPAAFPLPASSSLFSSQVVSTSAAAPISGSAHSFLSGVATKASDVVVGALNMIGVRYRWGGNTPDSGLDCSGFVRYVFQDTLGLTLPRRAEEMSRVGEKVSFRDLKPGDLVFFNTIRRQLFSHVGIYIGDNKFVHAPSTGSTIRVDEIDSAYWEKRFTTARRINVVYKPGNGNAGDASDVGADSSGQPPFNLIKTGTTTSVGGGGS